MNDIVSFVLRDLATRGFPVTEQRRNLVSVVMSYSRCFTADELLRASEQESLKVGRATVFRTLDLLVRLGHISKLREGKRIAYAVCSPGRHHHHLTCSGCGQVVHFSECPASDLLAELEEQTGYNIEYHSLELSGVCPSCQGKSPELELELEPERERERETECKTECEHEVIPSLP